MAGREVLWVRTLDLMGTKTVEGFPVSRADAVQTVRSRGCAVTERLISKEVFSEWFLSSDSQIENVEKTKDLEFNLSLGLRWVCSRNSMLLRECGL